MLPFTPEQFLGVFVNYNNAIWPIQIAAYVLGAISIASLLRRTRAADRVIAGILAAMWLWTGIAYHGVFFATINRAAYLFGALFVIQGAYLLYSGVHHDRLRFGLGGGPTTCRLMDTELPHRSRAPRRSKRGHVYPEMPVFGVTPCPVTIFTFGMFLLTTQPISRWLLVIPFIWSLIGGSAAVLLHVPQDWLLLVSGFITVLLIIVRDRAVQRLAASGGDRGLTELVNPSHAQARMRQP